jgi:hypothetical protein
MVTHQQDRISVVSTLVKPRLKRTGVGKSVQKILNTSTMEILNVKDKQGTNLLNMTKSIEKKLLFVISFWLH